MKKTFLSMYPNPNYLFDDPVRKRKFKNGRLIFFWLQLILALVFLGWAAYILIPVSMDTGDWAGLAMVLAIVVVLVFGAIYIGVSSLLGLIDIARAKSYLKKELKTVKSGAKKQLISATITMKTLNAIPNLVWLLSVLFYAIASVLKPFGSSTASVVGEYAPFIVYFAVGVMAVFFLYLVFGYFPKRKKLMQAIDKFNSLSI